MGAHRVGPKLGKAPEHPDGIAGQPRVQQQPAELLGLLRGERPVIAPKPRRLAKQQIPNPGRISVGSVVQQQARQPTTCSRILRVQPHDDIQVAYRQLIGVFALPQLSEVEVRVGVVRLDLEHAPELLARFGQPVHVQQQLAQVQQRVEVARIGAQFAQVQLARPLMPTGSRVRLGQPRLDPRQLRIDPRRLAQTPHSLVAQPAVQE